MGTDSDTRLDCGGKGVRVEIWPPPDHESRGGQHVGSGPSGVKVTHLATGITATCEAGRSQHVNRTIAMDMVLSAITHPMFDRLDTRPLPLDPSLSNKNVGG